MSKKIILLAVILSLLVLSGAVAFLFRSDIQSLLSLNNGYSSPVKDLRGETIGINIGGRQITIPPNFSEEVLTYLKREMTENGGLPLEIEKKGNPLPFGIP